MFRHVKNWLQQDWLKVVPPLTRRSTVPARKRVAQARVECLESRCLLALAPVGTDFNLTFQAGGNAVFNSGNQRELELPQFELALDKAAADREEGGMIPLPNELWQPESKSNPSANAAGNSTPHVPDAVPDDASESGGLVDLPDETGPEASADPAPFDGPSPREVHSVLQMLAALQYPLSGGEASDVDDDDLLAELDEPLRQPDSMTSVTEGGSIAIAIGEIADELEAAQPWTPELEQSLLEISVQMDRSAGRFQAFEVLTLEETSLPSYELPLRDFQPTAQPAAVNSEEARDEKAAQRSTPASQSSTPGSDSKAAAVAAEGALPLASDAEKSGSTWSLAIAVVTFGFVLQLLHDRHCERLKAQASAIWQSLIVVRFWKSARQPTRPVK